MARSHQPLGEAARSALGRGAGPRPKAGNRIRAEVLAELGQETVEQLGAVGRGGLQQARHPAVVPVVAENRARVGRRL